MKSEESTNKKNQSKRAINAKTKVVLLVFAFMIVVAIAVVPLTKIVTKAIQEEEREGFTKFRTSRYFFRLFYPEEWESEEDMSGFLLDDESGLVVRIKPAEGISIEVYYRAGENVSLTDAMKNFETYFKDFEFGEEDRVNVESEKCELLAKTVKGKDKSGTVYTATRSMCYYGILVTYENEKDYNTYKKQITDVIKSFEKQVFED